MVLTMIPIGLAMGDHSAREVDAIGWRGPFESTGRTWVGLASAIGFSIALGSDHSARTLQGFRKPKASAAVQPQTQGMISAPPTGGRKAPR